MKRRLLPLSLLLLLIATTLRPDAAVACFPDTSRNPLEASDLVVLGRVARQTDFTFGEELWDVEVIRTIQGEAGESIELRQHMAPTGDCFLDLHDGDVYVFVLTADTLPGPYTLAANHDAFGTSNLGDSTDEIADGWLNRYIADKDTPWAVVLPLAFAIPLATLLVPAFLRRRSAGH